MYTFPDYESDTCPRRYVIREPWIVDAHALYQATDEGKPGLDVLELTTRQAEALRTVGAAVGWRMEQEREERERERKRKSGGR